MRKRRAEAFRAQREVTVLQRHAFACTERRVSGDDEMHFLIADAVPCTVEGKRGARNFLEAEHTSVKRLRARKIAHRNCHVVKNLKVKHTFYILLFTSSGRAHHIRSE